MFKNIPKQDVRRLSRHALLSAVGGVTIGQCYKNWRENPNIRKRIINFTLASGCCGSVVGMFLGLRSGRNIPVCITTQTLYWGLSGALFCNIRSTLSNKKLTYPGRSDEPIKEVVISTISSGYFFALFSLCFSSSLTYILSSATFGIIFGFAGHLLYERLHIMRLEFLLRQNHPELMERLRQADNYVNDQVTSNPFYDGPLPREHPIYEYLLGVVEDNRAKIEAGKKSLS